MQAHRIIQTRFDIACAARRRTVKVRNLDVNRLCAALEVRSHRRDKNAELIVLRRLHTDDRADAEHIRTDIQRSAAAIRRNPGLVAGDHLLHRLDKFILRVRRHLKAQRGIVHSLRIQIRTETDNMAIRRGIRLQSFKDRLGILQNTGILAHDNLVVRNQAALIPGAVPVIGDITLVRDHIAEAKASPVNILLLYHHYLLLRCPCNKQQRQTQISA